MSSLYDFWSITLEFKDYTVQSCNKTPFILNCLLILARFLSTSIYRKKGMKVVLYPDFSNT